MLIRARHWVSPQCISDADLGTQSRRLPRRRVMRQRSLPRPLDTEHIAIGADQHSEELDLPKEEEAAQPLIATQSDRHPLELTASAPARMELMRAGSSRHKDGSRHRDAIAIMGLPLSPELAAIALGQSVSLGSVACAAAACAAAAYQCLPSSISCGACHPLKCMLARWISNRASLRRSLAQCTSSRVFLAWPAWR